MLGQRVKEIRKGLGLTMKKFAEPLGLSESAISHIENGSANPSESTKKLICSVYGVDYFWVTEGKGKPFINATQLLLEQLAIENHWDSETLDIMKKLYELPPEQFELVQGMIKIMKDE